jgi:hypothetical protein
MDSPEKRERVEIPHTSSPILAATEEQEFAGVIIYGTHRSIVGELRELFACMLSKARASKHATVPAAHLQLNPIF